MSSTFSFVDKLGTTLFFLSVFGFMGVFPLLLAAFTRSAAVAGLVLAVVLLSAYFVGPCTPSLNRSAISSD
jgi:hypothetical protein